MLNLILRNLDHFYYVLFNVLTILFNKISNIFILSREDDTEILPFILPHYLNLFI